MTWTEIDDEKALTFAKADGTHYLLFFASGTPPWCPDCREAQPHLEKLFNAPGAPTLNVVRVGTREEWKTPENKWRSEPYKVSSTPTIIKLRDGKELGRLGDEECKSEKEIKKLLGKGESEAGWNCVTM